MTLLAHPRKGRRDVQSVFYRKKYIKIPIADIFAAAAPAVWK